MYILEVLGSYTAQEKTDIAHSKRFMERVGGDGKFREKLNQKLEDPRELAREYQIKVDPRELQPLYRPGLECDLESGDFRLTNLFLDYQRRQVAVRPLLRALGNTESIHPRFDRWRNRQMKRVDSQCGRVAPGIVHPVIAFELSDGCSVGCWFCGISADRFQGAWPYSGENAKIWADVLAILVNRLGSAAQTGFLYWATDPMDNPDYPRFLEDYQSITGFLPQTTTAQPLKNTAMTREVQALFEQYGRVVNRFSILSPKLLDRIHAEFSAEEMIGVEVVNQSQESTLPKAAAGKALERKHRTADPDKIKGLKLTDSSEATIACVTGLLVNMPKGTIRLVSPTAPSNVWPDGYKIFGEASFDSSESFAEGLDALLGESLCVQIDGASGAQIRPDLKHKSTDTGFRLESPSCAHNVTNRKFGKQMGRLLAEGVHTYGEILRELTLSGADFLTVQSTLDNLFQSGALLEPVDLAGVTDKSPIPG